MSGAGPLDGLRVLEIESIGPGPFAAMLLADLGASVLLVRRPGPSTRMPNPVLYRNRAGSVSLDIKTEAGREQLMTLIAQADGLIEGYRPDVMERLGIGPEACLAQNQKLIYGRITGWGRSGPLARTAGHDINYIALSGVLHAMGTAQSGPVPPLNLVGDFGGGGLLLAFGMVCALLESNRSGQGQVVDAAMIDGSTTLMAMIYGMRAAGRWPAGRAGNLFDGSAWFYTTYRCADGQWVAVGPVERPFRMQMLGLLGFGVDAETMVDAPAQDAGIRERIAQRFAAAPRAHWEDVFSMTDACVTPVLSMAEAKHHPHMQSWGSVTSDGAVDAPRPAPRFSRSAVEPPDVNGKPGRLALWNIASGT